MSVLSQHAENASFLWELRNRAVAAPHYSLADLAKLDLRVEANLDGLLYETVSGLRIELLSTRRILLGGIESGFNGA